MHDFASRIPLLSVVASYAVGLACELLRVFWPARLPRWLATGWTLAALFAHTLFLAHRWSAEGQLPIATQYESLIVVAWIVGLIYLYSLIHDRQWNIGLFLVPMILLLLGGAAAVGPDAKVAADATTESLATGRKVLLTAHGMFLLLGTVCVVIALGAALMYLVKNQQLKSAAVRGPIALPSLERLDRVNTVTVWLAWPLLTAGIMLGFLPRSDLAWTDPKILTTLLAWVVFTAVAHTRFSVTGKRMAWMTIGACLLVLVSVLGDPIFGTGHQMLR